MFGLIALFVCAGVLVAVIAHAVCTEEAQHDATAEDQAWIAGRQKVRRHQL